LTLDGAPDRGRDPEEAPVTTPAPGVDPEEAAARPVHLRWRSLGLVFVGGSLGTGTREALALTFPAAPGTLPVTIALINVVGSFALGLLLESLLRRGPDRGRRRDLRLLVGTGVLGGFTTYSALTVDTGLLLDGHAGVALAYALGSVVAGVLAAAGGVALGAALSRGRDRSRARPDRRHDS
jgi:CrcB protein